MILALIEGVGILATRVTAPLTAPQPIPLPVPGQENMPESQPQQQPVGLGSLAGLYNSQPAGIPAPAPGETVLED